MDARGGGASFVSVHFVNLYGQVGPVFKFDISSWTIAQRDALAFWLEEADVPADWAADSVVVPDESEARVRAFADFLCAEPVSMPTISPVVVLPGRRAGDISAEPPAISDSASFSAASPGLRLAGFVVDAVFLGAIGLPFAYGANPTGAWVQFALVACYTVGFVAYLAQTLGNMAVHTRVVRVRNHGAPGLRAGFVRWLVPVGPLLLRFVIPGSGSSPYGSHWSTGRSFMDQATGDFTIARPA